MSTATTPGDVFRLRNDENAAHFALKDLQAWIRRLAEQRYGFGEARLRQVWVVVWEAIQNAIKYGSAPGEEVAVRLAPASVGGRLEVTITQPRAWDGPRHLGAPRKKLVDSGEWLLGGTVVMLWLADEVRVEDGGRRLVLRFSPSVKEVRRLNPALKTFRAGPPA